MLLKKKKRENRENQMGKDNSSVCPAATSQGPSLSAQVICWDEENNSSCSSLGPKTPETYA